MRCRQIRWEVHTRVPAPADWPAQGVVQVFLGVRADLDRTRRIMVLDEEDRGFSLGDLGQSNALRLFDQLEADLTVRRLEFYGFERIPDVSEDDGQSTTGTQADSSVSAGPDCLAGERDRPGSDAVLPGDGQDSTPDDRLLSQVSDRTSDIERRTCEGLGMEIPDPIEQMEARIEAMAEEVFDGVPIGQARCPGCKRVMDANHLITVSPAPDSPVCCYDCLSPEDQLAFDQFEASMREKPANE